MLIVIFILLLVTLIVLSNKRLTFLVRAYYNYFKNKLFKKKPRFKKESDMFQKVLNDAKAIREKAVKEAEETLKNYFPSGSSNL